VLGEEFTPFPIEIVNGGGIIKFDLMICGNRDNGNQFDAINVEFNPTVGFA